MVRFKSFIGPALASAVIFFGPSAAARAATGAATQSKIEHDTTHDALRDTATMIQAMSLDVTNSDIKDLVRMVSRGYGLNLVVDKDVKGAVTLHLTSVPIIEGLTAIARSLDLDIVKDGAVYHLRQKETPQSSDIALLPNGRLKVDARDADVRNFLEDLSRKSGASIVFDDAVQGRITGKLVNVPFDDGLKAILEGNGYKVTNQKNIYRVTSDYDVSGAPARRHAVGAASYPFFVNVTNNLVSLDARSAELEEVVRALGKEAHVQVVTYGDVSGKINAQIEDVTYDEAMDVLLGGTHYTYIRRGKMILIGDRNASVPSGQALSISEMIPLNHLKAEDVLPIIPVNIPAANIKVVKEQNALLVSGTSIDISHVKAFLATVDIPTPQVIIDVYIIEYTMDKSLDIGLELGLDATVPNSESFPNVTFSREGNEARNMVQNVLGQPVMKYVGYLGDNFFVRLRALASQNKAKVLAQPSITVLNGHKATINVGQTQYFKIVTPGSTAETMSYRFQPISFGITVNLTPWVAPSGQITADIAPEISNSMGMNSDGYPNVFTRSVSTTVRLNNNETLVLGGLIRRDEQVSNNKVPLLGDIPWIGNLFKTTTKEDIATNLAVYMTPHIITKDVSVDISRKVRDLGFRDVKKEAGMNESFPPADTAKCNAPVHKKMPSVPKSLPDTTHTRPVDPRLGEPHSAAEKKAVSRAEEMVIDVPFKKRSDADRQDSIAQARAQKAHDLRNADSGAERPPNNDDDFYIQPGRSRE